MMTRTQWLLITTPIAIIIIGLLVLVLLPNKPAQRPSSPTYATIDNLIAVDAPFKNATVSSPLVISGTARGTWYFEASAPIELRDANGKVIAQGHIDANPPAGGDWMTEEFVPFKATLTFPKQPAGSTGTLVLHNDNPSGDPERQKELVVPVKF
ncbi:Gmad2 immunoglobulin-like domain-containing protein [Patescibacteria group bacterium]|nr:Gmad2 immunoglobulin-like domain-containing protein [Patescibacteria group bacterium]